MTAQTQYTLQVLRSHSPNTTGLQTIFQSVVVSKLLYASTAWSSFTSVADHQRADVFLCRSKCCNFCPPYLWTTKIRPLLHELHWLRVPERIIFRLATLAYRCLHNMAPHYLAIQLNRASSVASGRRLRSASTSELIVPRTSRSTIGDRAFCVTAARAWNTLTPSVQSSESLPIFRRRLKTELFSRSFPD